MKLVLSSKDKKRILIYFGVVVIGILLVWFASSTYAETPQCPSYETPESAGYDCIIGADIGRGMIWLLGIAITLSGAIGLTYRLIRVIVATKTKNTSLIRSITLFSTLILMVTMYIAYRLSIFP